MTNVNSDSSQILKRTGPLQYERKYGLKPVREFGGWLGALVASLTIPTVGLISHMSCTKVSL